MDDLELLGKLRSAVQPPAADRISRARRSLIAEFGSPPPRRRSWVPAVLAISAPAFGATAVALVLTGVFSSGGPGVADAAIIRHADAALTAPPNEILYTDVAGGGFGAQTWQLTSPPYSSLGFKGPLGRSAPEDAESGTTSSYWDPATNTIHEQPAGPPAAFDDPLAEARVALHRGDARVLGTATVDGVQTYAIQFASKEGYNSAVTAYVDQRTYRPVLLRDPQRDGSVVMLKVLAFRFLPANAANMRLLSLTARHPTARVVTAAGSSKLAPAK
jgi:hypothetical protein